jgi:hypothetical protein
MGYAEKMEPVYAWKDWNSFYCRVTYDYVFRIFWTTFSAALVFKVLFKVVCWLLFSSASDNVVHIDEAKSYSPTAKITSVLTNTHSPPDDICAICMDTFTRPVKLPCNHIFCDTCIRTSLSQRDTCPYCMRVVFRSAMHQTEELE